MSKRLAGEDARLWSLVTATVRPLPGRATPAAASAAASKIDPKAPAATMAAAPVPVSRLTPAKRVLPPDPIEPRRRRNIARGRAPLEATLDLHGHGQFDAQDVLRGFLLRAYDGGLRAVLVITGRGVAGQGVIRRLAPEWLAAADLRHVVAGFSESHQKHGGEGALYVAIKRKAGP